MAQPYDSAYLLRMLRRYVGRANIADAITPATYYERLSEAQAEIVMDIAAVFPQCLYPTASYSAIPTLTTTDNQTFTFGTDPNGFALAPVGKTEIYRSLNDIPHRPMVQGRDFVMLGSTAIQIPDNGQYGGTLYWRGITMPGVISESSQPVLFPEASRSLIPLRAAINFLMEGGRNMDLAHEYQSVYGRPFGLAPGLFASHMLAWQTSFQGGGALLTPISGLRVAVGSANNYGGFF